MELIRGKWYKNLGEKKDHIGRFSGWHNSEIISVSEYIYEGKLRGASDCFTKAYKFAEECPLSEIQQYLPEGHPDKEFVLPEKWCVEITASNVDVLSKWRGNEDLKSGEIYGYLHSDLLWREDIRESTEITFDQFKKNVLKTKDMEEKEIIGYKLKEDCRQYEEAALKIINANWGTPKYHVINSWCIKNLRKAGVLELWFEPIYREEFKTGDAIIVLNPNGTNSCGLDINKLYYIIKIANDGQYGNEKYCSCSNIKNGPRVSQGYIKLSGIRLATSEEIKKTLVEEAIKRGFTKGVKIKAYFPDYSPVYSGDRPYKMNDGLPVYEQHSDAIRMGGLIIYHKGKWAEILPSYPQIEINGYKGEFFDDYVKFGCAKISREVFIDSNKLFKHNSESVFDYTECNRRIESITIGKGTFTKDQIKLIAEYYLNKK